MKNEIESFETIASAQQYVSRLIEAVSSTQRTIEKDVEPDDSDPRQCHDALLVVNYKLERLAFHLATSKRLLLDLGVLRELICGDPQDASRPVDAPRTLPPVNVRSPRRVTPSRRSRLVAQHL
jgi:hypothetical protein